MNYENLILEIKESIAQITINRPDKLNALNSLTLTELEDAIDNIKENDDVNVVIITGAGEKAFVAGADIKELNQLNMLKGRTFAEKGQRIFSKIVHLGKPVIAAVNGYALGGGCELALACHIRFASEQAKFGQPEVNLGIIPGYGGTQRLARLIGSGRALEYILTGDMIDAEEAFRIGLANRVVQHDELMAKAWELAQKISSKGQLAVRLAVDAVVSTNDLSEREGLLREADLFAICCGTEDFKEGTSAFLEKRKAEFKNK